MVGYRSCIPSFRSKRPVPSLLRANAVLPKQRVYKAPNRQAFYLPQALGKAPKSTGDALPPGEALIGANCGADLNRGGLQTQRGNLPFEARLDRSAAHDTADEQLWLWSGPSQLAF